MACLAVPVTAKACAGEVLWNFFNWNAVSWQAAAIDATEFKYDGLDRVVQSVDSCGNAIQYRYDASGNVLAVAAMPSSTLSVAGLAPVRGAPGSAVTLVGTGFSSTPSANTVKFNGVSATVAVASATELSVSVPATATSGTVSVTVGTATSMASPLFTVAAVPGTPTVSSFTPALASAGATVAISGTDFDPLAGNNQVRFGDVQGVVAASTPTSLSVTVPLSPGSGKLSIDTSRGQSLSASDFFVLDAGVAPTDVVNPSRLSVNSGTTTFAFTSTSQRGIFLFDATRGQYLTIAAAGITVAGAQLNLRDPHGRLVFSSSLTTSTVALFPPMLLDTGTYAATVAPSSSGSVSFAVYGGGTASLILSDAGPVASIPIANNSRALATFDGAVGQFTSVWFIGPSGSISIAKPDGSVLATSPVSATPRWLELPEFDTSGPYTVLYTPQIGVAGTLNVRAYLSKTGTLSTVNNTVVTLQPGQVGRYTFSSSAGVVYALLLRHASFSSAVNVDIYRPSDLTTPWKSSQRTASSAGVVTPLSPLPEQGTYVVMIRPSTSSTGALTLFLEDNIGGATHAIGSSFLQSIGSGDLYYFSVPALVAGKTYTVAFYTPSSTPPVGVTPTAAVSLYGPDGSFIGNCTTTAGSPYCSWPSSSFSVSGTYYFAIIPPAGAAPVGNFGVYGLQSGSVSVGGSTTVALAGGEAGRFTFAASSALTGYLFSDPAQPNVGASQVYTTVDGAGTYNRVQCPLYQLGCYFPASAFASTGTYAIRLDRPSSSVAISANPVLASDVAATMAFGATTTVALPYVGQHAALKLTASGSFTIRYTNGPQATASLPAFRIYTASNYASGGAPYATVSPNSNAAGSITDFFLTFSPPGDWVFDVANPGPANWSFSLKP